jgi:hypothetical protein
LYEVGVQIEAAAQRRNETYMAASFAAYQTASYASLAFAGKLPKWETEAKRIESAFSAKKESRRQTIQEMLMIADSWVKAGQAKEQAKVRRAKRLEAKK